MSGDGSHPRKIPESDSNRAALADDAAEARVLELAEDDEAGRWSIDGGEPDAEAEWATDTVSADPAASQSTERLLQPAGSQPGEVVAFPLTDERDARRTRRGRSALINPRTRTPNPRGPNIWPPSCWPRI